MKDLDSLRNLGLLQGAVYAMYAFYFGWTPWVDPDWVDDLVIWTGIISLFLLYRAGYRVVCCKPLARPARSIALYAIPALLFATLTTPFDSSDAFLYLAMARAQSHYDLNPYSELLRSIPNVTADPAIGAMWMGENDNPWLDLPMVYGFLFANLTWLIGFAARGSWWLALFLLKGVILGAYAITGWVVLAAARKLGHSAPERAFYLFMWSPLILLHQIANAHNDLLMGALIAASFYVMLQGRVFWTIPLLVAAATVKYTAIVLLPFALVFVLRKRGLIHALGSSLAGALTFLVLGLPYLREAQQFIIPLILDQASKFTAGTITGALYYSYRAISRTATPLGTLEHFGEYLETVAVIAILIGLMLVAYRFLKGPQTLLHLVEAWTLSILVIMFLSPQFYAWYFGAFFPIALLMLPGTPLRELVIILSVTHLSSLASIGSKALGYFLLATVGGLIWWRRKGVWMAADQDAPENRGPGLPAL